ncbi:carboxymuconolactone decarboxylase family protein [Variovorax paradoxus]|uniref:carboxymuconolactone decarboxylase family protein n=1 Tax=Variovorax paradoxus TaxID=34073 RepID=UPI0029C6818B|nr:carboxymuconolactone decarboxylase family protein [Variovorax paradoxus]WPH18042.1 carboxymuconolactone decarboxylase family protein [Variovorax paradoxus]
MARIPYADISAPAVQPLVKRIEAERGSVLHLYQMLLHSVPLTEGWLGLLTAVRQRFNLNGAIRELVIMRVAVLNGAQYEADQHAPIALKEGITQAQIDALDDWRDSGLFDDLQRATLQLADTMTRNVHVPSDQLDDVRRHMGDATTVELVATVAAYNMVSRFLEALGIHSQDAFPGSDSVQTPPRANEILS